MTAVAGPDDVRRQILGRRTPASEILDEFRQADRWGILRFVPHGRMDTSRLSAAWIPDYEPADDPLAWHPEDALYAPLYSATGMLLGNMAVDLPPDNRIPSRHERELLEMFVVQAGLALSNAQQREQLAEQVRLGSTVKEVAQAGSQLGLDAILEEACEAVHRGLGATQVWIRCYPDEDMANGVAAGHPRPDPSGRGSRQPARRPVVGVAESPTRWWCTGRTRRATASRPACANLQQMMAPGRSLQRRRRADGRWRSSCSATS